ncbi:MAG: amidase family protein [Synechococcaceae cyanobacterium]
MDEAEALIEHAFMNRGFWWLVLQRNAVEPDLIKFPSFNETMRQHLSRAALGAVALTLIGAELTSPTLAASFTLQEASISSINQAFNKGLINAKKLVQLYLNRINTYDLPSGLNLNSVISLNPNALSQAAALDIERATTGARSLLHGIPILLKDNIDTFDLPTTGGSVALRGSVPSDDAFIVKQLRDAGAIILGKTNLDEWAHGGAPGGGYSSIVGQTRNPYKLNRGPAGSSAGTGAAISANFAVFGLGSDTGGSIRGPAASNGLVGIKPTLGLTSRDGIIPFSLTLDVAGPMARNVTDAAIALGVMTGIDQSDPVTAGSAGHFLKDYTPFLTTNALQGARIGVARQFFGGNTDVDGTIESAITTLRSLGAEIVDSIAFPSTVLSTRSSIYSTISDTEFKAQLADYLATLPGTTFPKTLADVITISQSLDVVNSPFPVNTQVLTRLFQAEVRGPATNANPEYANALAGRATIETLMLALFNDNTLDAIIYPTSRCPAAPLGGIIDPTYVCSPGPSPTNIANLTGFPDVQVPAGFTTDGLPIALSFFGRAYSEPELLGYAYAFEQATNARRPSPLAPPLAGETIVPGPLPIFGTGIAFSLTRRIRKRIRSVGVTARPGHQPC